MFELFLVILVAVGICLWGLFICELVDYIKRKNKKEEVAERKERIVFNLLCSTIFVMMIFGFSLAIIIFLKLNGISFEGMV